MYPGVIQEKNRQGWCSCTTVNFSERERVENSPSFPWNRRGTDETDVRSARHSAHSQGAQASKVLPKRSRLLSAATHDTRPAPPRRIALLRYVQQSAVRPESCSRAAFPSRCVSAAMSFLRIGPNIKTWKLILCTNTSRRHGQHFPPLAVLATPHAAVEG